MKKFFALIAVLALIGLPSFANAQFNAGGADHPQKEDKEKFVTSDAGSRNAAVGTGLAVIGAGLAVIGAGRGIGQIGGSALESIARQPAEAARIAANMIIAAALVEGAALFAIVVAFLKA